MTQNQPSQIKNKMMNISILAEWFTKAFTGDSDYLAFKELINESRHEISNNVIYATSKASDQPAHAHSLIRAFASRLNIL